MNELGNEAVGVKHRPGRCGAKNAHTASTSPHMVYERIVDETNMTILLNLTEVTNTTTIYHNWLARRTFARETTGP